MRNDQLAVLLRDFAKRANQWADVLEKEEQGEGTLKPLVTLLETPSERSERGPFAVRPTPPSSVVEVPPGFRTAYEIAQETGLLSRPTPSPTASTVRSLWRRGDYFFCESCGQRKQWFRDSAPWRGAICASCYNAELARIEAARGRKA